VFELFVDSDVADVIVSQLNVVPDQLEETHTISSGDIETAIFNQLRKRRRSALGHTLAAGETVAGALKSTSKQIGNPVRAVI